MRASIAVVLAVIAAASAQSPCIITCSTSPPATTYCPVLTNITCVCNDEMFQLAVGTCIGTTCPAELPAAQALHDAQCGGANSTSVSGSGTETGSATIQTSTSVTNTGSTTPKPTTPPTAGTSAPATTSTTRSAASALMLPEGMGIFAAALTFIGGALLF